MFRVGLQEGAFQPRVEEGWGEVKELFNMRVEEEGMEGVLGEVKVKTEEELVQEMGEVEQVLDEVLEEVLEEV